ncbi:MAG: PhzF family phenazine biosynthesis protein [Dehalococcoidia bacterium]|nr:PhzF family phenazine biosynthesis protein [Dehalococcoidia bacterium]MYA53976.1 PhzF family phenazine biosynthesis protein [Dehalococcoidia bacterium]
MDMARCYAAAMPEYEITIVDSFTTERYAGNPCAVVTRAEGLAPEQMQAIAREMNLSETAFVTPSQVADVRVRFFTPRKEIPLAGHPTIVTMHALVEQSRFEVGEEPRRITQELNVGVLPVDLSRGDGGRVRVAMTQATPQFHQELDRAAFADVLGISASDLLAEAPPQVISTGTRQAMIPVRSLAVLEQVSPDLERLAALETAEGYFSTHVFALETYDPANRVHSRHFGPSSGVWEDPVTGSATGGMAAYLWRHGLLREASYTVEQGHLMGRPGRVEVEVEGEGDTPMVVRIAGTAVTVLRGSITI